MPNIVVLGSLMQDLVVRAPRLPREGETLFAHDFATYVGGKGGNQAIAAALLGASGVAMIGRVGDDPFGETIINALRDSAVDVTHVARDPHAGTGVAIPIVLDSGENSILSIPRANLAITAAQVEAARLAIARASILVLQFEVSWEANLAAAAIARAADVPILLNAAPASDPPRELIAAASWIIVNEREADALVPGAVDRLGQAEKLRALGPGVATITLGGEGSVTATADSTFSTSAIIVNVVDSVGAGDAFCGAVAVAVSEGMSPREAVRLASIAGGLAVTRPGAAASLPDRAAVQRLLDEGTISLP